ncbi:sigma-E factor regulatory protein RseB domain-containing protein [Streptosporangium jomthongense]|uniref:Sigma-E factor regulatory protein RseB domain-containing protein n=1 Tax=Streptosporangium jomthongense TaxID=1193683 RepID=A0ABV8FBC9_9ACTN
MIRLPACLAVVVAMVLGLVAGSPARAVQQSVQQGERDEDTGLRLLREAAAAARGRGYSGTQYVTTWGRSGSFSSMVEVRNVPGRGLSVSSRPSGTAGWVDPGTPAGSMAAPSETMLEVLARNYRVVDAGRTRTGGRAAHLVDVLRTDGTPVARYWLDESGGLALRRELFDGRGRTVHVGGFLDLTLDPVARGSVVPVPPPGGLDLGEVPELLDRGWRFPAELPGRLELFAAHTAPAGYLYLGYSDGLSVVSVFVDSGVLDGEKLRGWHAQRHDGHTIWMRNSAEQGTIWASGDHVYTVFADAPADTVDAAVAALPHEPAPNLWNRLGRGAHRLLSWVNPFG